MLLLGHRETAESEEVVTCMLAIKLLLFVYLSQITTMLQNAIKTTHYMHRHEYLGPLL